MPSPDAFSPDPSRTNAARPLTNAPPLIVIAGATATGKTHLSLALADAIGEAQVISADSRQIFRGMDIGTGKVDTETRRRVLHHGLDLADPDELFTVADYMRHVHCVLADLAERRAVAVLAGGTGFYLRAVARGVPVGDTGRNAALRAELEARLLTDGLAPLVKQLQRNAPGVAAATDLANSRRVVRALERVDATGNQPPPAPLGYPGPILWLGLAADPAEHRAAIADRAAGQFSGGLLDEAAALRERYGSTPAPFSAIGYREAFAVLDGRRSTEEAIDVTAQRTWGYARRQRTWFRSEPDITWLLGTERQNVAIALETAKAFLERGRP